MNRKLKHTDWKAFDTSNASQPSGVYRRVGNSIQINGMFRTDYPANSVIHNVLLKEGMQLDPSKISHGTEIGMSLTRYEVDHQEEVRTWTTYMELFFRVLRREPLTKIVTTRVEVNCWGDSKPSPLLNPRFIHKHIQLVIPVRDKPSE